MLKQRLKSFKYAFIGIKELFSSEPNAVIHLIAAILAVFAGYFFSISNQEWCIIVICIGTVLSAEAMNTAIEHLTDLVSPEHHELARKTKDAAAGGVLFVAISASICGIIVFLPKLLDWLF